MMHYQFDQWGWLIGPADSPTVMTTEVVPPDADGSCRPYWTGASWVLREYVAQGIPPESGAPAVPSAVSKFQAKAALFNAGLLDAVESIMSDPATPTLAKLAWSDAQEFLRDSPTVMMLAQALELTDDALNDLFRSAAEIKA